MVSVVAFASDIKNISITYEYISENPNETPKQAEENAFRNAQTKALEEKFGLDLVGMTAFYQSEQLTNEKVIFSENFLSSPNFEDRIFRPSTFCPRKKCEICLKLSKSVIMSTTI